MKIALRCLCIVLILFYSCKKSPVPEIVDPPVVVVVEKATVSGTVKNITGNPLESVEVVIVGTEIKTTTNSFGDYKFPEMPISKIKLTISHPDFKTEEKEIQLVKGTNSVDFKFVQSSPLAIVSKTDGYTLIPDSVSVTFNRAVTVTSLLSVGENCNTGAISSSISNYGKTVRFSYRCLKLGGSFPFIITVKDKNNHNETFEFNIDYYTQKLGMTGNINNFLISEDNQMCWLLVTQGETGKVVGVSLKDFKIVKEYPVNKSVSNFAYNSYNKMLYILTRSPLILKMNLETGTIVKEIPTDVLTGETANHPMVLEFARNGYGLLSTYQPNTSRESLRAIESDKNDAMMAINLQNGSTISKFTLDEFSKNFFYVFGIRATASYTLNAETKEILPFNVESGAVFDIVTSKLGANALIFRGNKMIVYNSVTGYTSSIRAGNGGSGNFSYKKYEDDLYYYFDTSSAFFLYNFKQNGVIRQIGTVFNQLTQDMTTVTTDGKYLLLRNRDQLYVFSTSMFTLSF